MSARRPPGDRHPGWLPSGLMADHDGCDELLDAIDADLRDVEAALARLDAGTYWSDEVTGAVLPDELLAERPGARRVEARPWPSGAGG